MGEFGHIVTFIEFGRITVLQSFTFNFENGFLASIFDDFYSTLSIGKIICDVTFIEKIVPIGYPYPIFVAEAVVVSGHDCKV